MTDTILNWNYRGFCRNIEENKICIQEYNPLAICLRETCIDQTKTIDFRKYSSYNYYSKAINGKPIDHVSILSRKSIPHR
jgi:hypothetical protein